jgi:glycosyltransferase involved in cell wall biosynthesis
MTEAVGRLPADMDFHVVMAGPGEEVYVDYLHRMARERGVLDRLSFVGMVSGELKRSLYQACDLFVSPTEQENFGMVYPEALACGLPIVTTETVDTAVELKNAGAKLVPRTVDAFAEAISESLADLDKLRALGKRGREYVVDWLDTKKVAEQYMMMYRNAAETG